MTCTSPSSGSLLINKHLLSKRELRQWNDAIDEYHRRVESGDVI
jgi:hypothetical protein